MQRWLVRESNLNHICLIEIHRRYSATLFSRYSFAKSWRRADEKRFAFAAVVPAYFAGRPDRSWILAYHVVLSGLLIVSSRYTLCDWEIYKICVDFGETDNALKLADLSRVNTNCRIVHFFLLNFNSEIIKSSRRYSRRNVTFTYFVNDLALYLRNQELKSA